MAKFVVTEYGQFKEGTLAACTQNTEDMKQFLPELSQIYSIVTQKLCPVQVGFLSNE